MPLTLIPDLQKVLESSAPAGSASVRGRTVSFSDGGTTLEGCLAVPADRASRPAPAVLVIHNWNGTGDRAAAGRSAAMDRFLAETLAA